MAAFVKYDQFVVDLCAAVHDLTTAGSLLRCALSNTAPTVATDETLAGITTIAYTNVSETWPIDIANVGSESPAGTWNVAGTDVTATASGGAVATFRYVILYNDTPTSPADPLIGYWDHGSAVDLADGESFTVDFDPTSVFTVT